MNDCDVMQAAVVDEALPRPPGFEAHLETCAECRAMATAHRAALRLRGEVPGVARRRSLAEAQRRGGIVMGLVLALGGGAGLWALEVTKPVPVAVVEPAVELEAPTLEEAPLTVEPPGELLALAQLTATVYSNLSRDPREDAAARRAFGALPAWTAPRRTQPIRSLGRAASPLVFTSEDSP